MLDWLLLKLGALAHFALLGIVGVLVVGFVCMGFVAFCLNWCWLLAVFRMIGIIVFIIYWSDCGVCLVFWGCGCGLTTDWIWLQEFDAEFV